MTINANSLVNVTPSVIAPGGSNLVMNGLMLTANTRVPNGTVMSFPNITAVGNYFGTAAAEYSLAATYFSGFNNSRKKPSALLMAQLPYMNPVAAYLRGASVTGAAPLATLNGITNGVFNITIDGAVFAASNINFSAATSYSQVASILQTALQSNAPNVATGTGSISGKTMTISALTSGTFAVGQTITGGTTQAGTYITALGTGTGGTGTYTVNQSQTVANTTLNATPAAPTVTYDSILQAFSVTSGSTGTGSSVSYPNQSNALSSTLGLQASNGAVQSLGSAAITGTAIAGALTAIYQVNRNWVTLFTVFEPTTADKLNFASWVNPLPVAYAMWDTITAPAAASSTDTTSAGYQIRQAGYSGVMPIYLDQNLAAFVAGAGASIDYTRTNGRDTLAYLTSSSVTPMVTNDTTAANLLANGYNFYGSYANAGNGFIMYQNGSITGNFAWTDSYWNQIWLNNNIQTSLIQLLQGIGSIPYNPAGYALIRTALTGGANQANGQQPQSGQTIGPVGQALNFGAIRTGVVLSANEVAEVNAAAGLTIDGYLNQYGYYLQVLDPGATVRLARGSPIVNLWYMDGQSVQVINVASTDVQ